MVLNIFAFVTGTSKKIAKRAAAYEACFKLLGVTYPPEVYVPAEFPSY